MAKQHQFVVAPIHWRLATRNIQSLFILIVSVGGTRVSAVAGAGTSNAWLAPQRLQVNLGIDRVLTSSRGQQLVGTPQPLEDVRHVRNHSSASVRTQSGMSGKAVEVPLSTYPLVSGLVVVVVVILYGSRGPSVVCSVLCYLFALSTMKLSVKWVFVHNQFQFAKLVSATHFLMGGLACFGLLINRKWWSGINFPVPTYGEFLFVILPISLAVVVSIGAGNMSLVFCSASFTEVIGSTGCLITVGIVMVLGMPFQKSLVWPTMLVAIGCMLSTAGEINFSALGMLLCFVSNVFRSAKVALQQILMTGQSKDRFDPCVLFFWISLPSTLVMMLASLTTEGLEPFRHVAKMDATSVKRLLLAMGVSCANATALNLAQLFVTKELGAVGSQLVAQSKSLLTVLGGMVLFGEVVTYLEAVGFVQVLLGVFIFSNMEQRDNARQARQKLMQQSVSLGASATS